MNETTIDKVRAYKNGDKRALEELLEKFQPLIRSQARNFGTEEREDIEQELRIALYQAVEQIEYIESDTQVISYIAKTVRSRRIYLYGKYRKKRECETAIPEDMDFVMKDNPFEDVLFYHDFTQYMKKLPEKYQIILQQILIGRSDAEIAESMNMSRQYVNRIKKKMLSREYIF